METTEIVLVSAAVFVALVLPLIYTLLAFRDSAEERREMKAARKEEKKQR